MLDISDHFGYNEITMAGKPTVPFSEHVSKRVTAIQGHLAALTKLGARCDNPAHATKVVATISAQLEKMKKAWESKTSIAKDKFSL